VSFAIKVLGYADGRPCSFEDSYLRWYDPNVAIEEEGLLVLGEFTYDIALAKTFPDRISALEEWKRVREVDPIRPDGKPNRPLTVYTVTIEPVP